MKNIIIVIVLFLMYGCRDIFPSDEEFSFKKRAYTGTQLKTNGYYYSNYINAGSENIYIWFFYRDGTSLGGGAYNIANLLQVEQDFATGAYYNRFRDIKQSWGVFKIEGNQIRREHWGFTDGVLPVFVNEGVILNDTTFIMTKIWALYGSENRQINDVFHYKQFSPKPDSTNVFVK